MQAQTIYCIFNKVEAHARWLSDPTAQASNIPNLLLLSFAAHRNYLPPFNLLAKLSPVIH